MAQEKDRQEPIITKTVGAAEKSSINEFGGALGIPGNENRPGAIFTIGGGGFKAAMAMIFEYGKKLFGKWDSVHIMDGTTGKESVKDENGLDRSPVKKMSKEVHAKALEVLRKGQGLLTKEISSFKKKLAVGVMISLATASLFAGGLGDASKANLQSNYSTFNPRFVNGAYDTMIEINGLNQGMTDKYLTDFITEVINTEIAEWEKENGTKVSEKVKQDAISEYGPKILDVTDIQSGYSATLGSKCMTITCSDGADFDKLIRDLRNDLDKGKAKVIERDGTLPPPDINNLASYNGVLNADGSATFTYDGPSESIAKNRAATFFGELIAEWSRKGRISDGATQSELTKAKSIGAIQTSVNPDGTCTAKIHVSKDAMAKLGYPAQEQSHNHNSAVKDTIRR